MPPLGNYLLPIAPVADRATIKTAMEKYTHFTGDFDGHYNAAVYNTAHIAR
jgi:hypothetical protein